MGSGVLGPLGDGLCLRKEGFPVLCQLQRSGVSKQVPPFSGRAWAWKGNKHSARALSQVPQPPTGRPGLRPNWGNGFDDSGPWDRLASHPHCPYLSRLREASSARAISEDSPGSTLEEVPPGGHSLAQLSQLLTGGHCFTYWSGPQPQEG